MSIHSKAFRFAPALLGAGLLFAPVLNGQTTNPALPAPSVPITSQTAPTTVGNQATPTEPMSKKEMKKQRKRQKHNEKSASESAKAQKDSANAMKHADKSQNEQQKSTPPQ